MPTYNSEGLVLECATEALEYLARQPYTSELILIDDGSQDNTFGEIQKLSQKNHLVRGMCFEKNSGKGACIQRASSASLGQYIIFTDIDLAYPIEEISKILTALERGNDAAIACRVLQESRFTMSPSFFRYLYTRHLMGRFFNLIVRSFLLPEIYDTQAGLKGFRRDAAQKLFRKQTLRRFSFDVELLYIARKLGLRVEQVAVNFRYFFEESSVLFFKDTLSMLKDLLRIRLNDLRGIYDAPFPESLAKDTDPTPQPQKVLTPPQKTEPFQPSPYPLPERERKIG
ncbi:MAG: glycosyltransferase [Elusimicrobia bacterium]|nr:glycosyltransferase [Elusimicrobiota bacterium]